MSEVSSLPVTKDRLSYLSPVSLGAGILVAIAIVFLVVVARTSGYNPADLGGVPLGWRIGLWSAFFFTVVGAGLGAVGVYYVDFRRLGITGLAINVIAFIVVSLLVALGLLPM